AASIIFLLLVGGIAGTTWGLIRAERSRRQAQERLRQVEKGSEILASVFADLDPAAEEKEGKPLRAILGDRLTQAAEQLEGGGAGGGGGGGPAAGARPADPPGQVPAQPGHGRPGDPALREGAGHPGGQPGPRPPRDARQHRRPGGEPSGRREPGPGPLAPGGT